MDGSGNTLRSFTAPGVKFAFQASRRPDGNYLLSGGYAKAVFVLSPEGKIIRRLEGEQPSGLSSYFYSGFQQLPGGHIVMANWNGHNDSDYTEGLRLFELDDAGRGVWTWTAPKERLGSLTNFIILDGLDLSLPHGDANGVLEPLRHLE